MIQSRRTAPGTLAVGTKPAVTTTVGFPPTTRNPMNSSTKPSGTAVDIHQQVTDRILELLERGAVPWQKPWDTRTGPPSNFSTGKPYQGINILLLGMASRPSRWWMTYKQALERGGQVRKGERGTSIVKYGPAKPRQDPTDHSDDSPASTRTRMFLKAFTVFNACQIDGIEFPPDLPGDIRDRNQRIEEAERIVRYMPMPPAIREGQSVRAFYIPEEDHVEMPEIGRFHSPESYYSTLFHELVHSTGHRTRLARPSLMSFGNFADHAYSKEELVAEIGAALLASETGLVTDDLESSASYIQSWLRVLQSKEHRRWIVEAAGSAAKAVNFITRRGISENPD